MNIWWVKSRSTKKNKKNTTQAFLRWYENRKPITKKLEGMEDKIRNLTQNNDKNSDVLSPETIKAIDGFKAEMMATRSQLRNVKFDLRRDVELLKKWIISINVAILPIMFAAASLNISLRRKRKNSY